MQQSQQCSLTNHIISTLIFFFLFFKFIFPFLVTGVVRPGEFLAIMGASGAGKTTLLNCLTFRNTGKLKILGQRYLNGAKVDTDKLARISGYVQQDDLFMGTLSVKEQLRFHVYPKQIYYRIYEIKVFNWIYIYFRLCLEWIGT
jgi:ABC-type methionine transport system ATPase subunit